MACLERLFPRVRCVTLHFVIRRLCRFFEYDESIERAEQLIESKNVVQNTHFPDEPQKGPPESASSYMHQCTEAEREREPAAA